MLCQFTFKNFKSYKETNTFDLQATSIPEFSDSVLFSRIEPENDIKGCGLLPVSVIYGPNGGGKSNLLEALSSLISIVVRPIKDLDKTRNTAIIQQKVDFEPFKFNEVSKTEPIEFEIYFRQNKNEFHYSLCLSKEMITEESLHWRAIGGKRTGTIFERDASKIELGPSLRKGNINTKVNPKMPYLSFLSINYDIPIIKEVQEWFESCITINYASSITIDTITPPINEKEKNQILVALNDMGIDLSDYRIDTIERNLYTQRKVNGKLYELKYSEESEGTRKLIQVLPVILLALREGRLIIIDELDSKLHPKLLRYIISMFKNPRLNPKGAQLVFTSHDISTMKNTVFRRDEIWFASENSEHESGIYSLYEIRRTNNERINNTAAYDKQYLEGRYGSDPYLKNMLTGE